MVGAWTVVVATGTVTVVDVADTRVLQAISTVRSPWLTRVAEVAGILGTGWALHAIWLANLLTLAIVRRWRHLCVWVGVGLVVINVGAGLASLLQRPRPYEVEILGPWAGFSMPSLPMTVLSAFLVSTVYALIPAGQFRRSGSGWSAGSSRSPRCPGSTSPRTTRPTCWPGSSSVSPSPLRHSGCSLPTTSIPCATAAAGRPTWT